MTPKDRDWATWNGSCGTATSQGMPQLWVLGPAHRAPVAFGEDGGVQVAALLVFGVGEPLGLELGFSQGVPVVGSRLSPYNSRIFCLPPLAGALGSREEPEFVTARAGESVILGCDVIHPLTGQPPPYVVEWFKFGVPIPIFIKFGFYPPHVDPGYAGEAGGCGAGGRGAARRAVPCRRACGSAQSAPP